MTRDQAKAIMQNIDLVRHFAEGGEIAFRAFNHAGEAVAIWPAKGINITNMMPDKHCLYVKAKARMVWNAAIKNYEHVPRSYPTKLTEAELIKD